jgi:hypothetical protein
VPVAPAAQEERAEWPRRVADASAAGGPAACFPFLLRWPIVRSAPRAKPPSWLGAAVCIAVCDQAGHLVAFERMDGAPLMSAQLAQDKACSAAASVGFDDTIGSDFCHPPLSTVTAPVEQAGRTLIDLLLNPRDVRPAPHIVLPAVLRVRDSTGAADAGE